MRPGKAILTASYFEFGAAPKCGAIGPDRRKAMSKTARIAVVASRLRRFAT